MNSERLIVALDLDAFAEAEYFVNMLKDYVTTFKIGHQLFTAEGPKVVEMVRKNGCKVFLDLKYHDIPNTVAKAGVVATRMGVFMFNLHSLGGTEMMQRCRDAVVETSLKLGIQRPLIMGVTILTSMNQETLGELGMPSSLKEQVKHLSAMAYRAGLDGVVASPQEVRLIKDNLGEGFLVVTPGIRIGNLQLKRGNAVDDQKRVMSVKDAIDAGADYIVVGRPIIEADDPVEATKKILKEIKTKANYKNK